MNVITEERRKDLIRQITDSIIDLSSLKDDANTEFSIDVFKIALASLTAKREYNIDFGDGDIRLNVTKSDFDKCDPDYFWVSYTAPPMQVIKLPESVEFNKQSKTL